MTEPAASSITLTAAVVAIGSTVGDVLGLDPTMIIWGFLGALLLVAHDTKDHDHRIRRAILLLLGGAIIAGGLGGLVMALVVDYYGSKPMLPLKVAIGVVLGMLSQVLVTSASGLIATIFTAIGDRFKKWIGGSNG